MAQKTKQLRPILRWSVDYAEEKFQQLYPTKRRRDAACRILAEAISVANGVASGCWNVTLDVQRERICLNVGQGAVLQLIPAGLLMIVTLSQLDDGLSELFPENNRYRYVADTFEGFLAIEDLKHYRHLRNAHHDLIERSAKHRSSALWPHAHSPGVIDYLISQGFKLKQPEYLAEAEPEVVETTSSPLIDRYYSEIASTEGRRRMRQHLAIERDSRLAKLKKKQVMQLTGKLACEVCGFDFRAVYGELGNGFAEAHHDVPLAASDEERLTSLDDLRIVCANCHRMLHRKIEALSIAALKRRINQNAECHDND